MFNNHITDLFKIDYPSSRQVCLDEWLELASAVSNAGGLG